MTHTKIPLVLKRARRRASKDEGCWKVSLYTDEFTYDVSSTGGLP